MVAHRADSPRAARLAPRLRQSTTLSGAGTGGTLAWGRAAFAVLRAGFVLITGRLIWRAGRSWRPRLLVAAGPVTPLVLAPPR